MEIELHRAFYIQAVIDYTREEYDLETMPEVLSQEMIDYLNQCYETLMCYPNAAGKFIELFRNVEQF